MTENETRGQEPPQEEAPRFPIDAAPLALGAFALNTFLLSWVNAGMVNEAAIEAAMATAWIYGGLIQVLVGFWELLGGRLFPAVTFGSYGSFWLSFAFFETLYAESIPAEVRGAATALFLAPWAIFSLYMLIGSVRTNVALVVAFVLVEVVLIPTAYGFATGNPLAIRIGGWAGVALAIDVWYVAAAEIINHQFRKSVLPLGELGGR